MKEIHSIWWQIGQIWGGRMVVGRRVGGDACWHGRKRVSGSAVLH